MYLFDCLPWLSNIHLSSFYSCPGLIAEWLLALNSILLRGSTTVYLHRFPAEGRLVCCQVLAIMNKAVTRHLCSGFCVDTCFQLQLWYGSIPKSLIWGSHGKSMFSGVKICQPVFQGALLPPINGSSSNAPHHWKTFKNFQSLLTPFVLLI